MQQTEWAPNPAGIAGIGAGGILMATACVTVVADAPGRILASVAAVGLIVFALGSWRARPRLAITPEGLVYRGWIRTQTLRRPDITLIRITEFRRIGRKVRLLEIDTTDNQLIVLSRWDLGTDPLDVLDALTDAGYAGR
ncbi:PH domain-containing protein [Candidatus Mycolicibacterium alkanivorans]|uniref:PH domain-containing protein n=1 Tax=Candidatus Mycolicibacterium alkanivorans TaxID=2954114 RepID=A0ABS9YRY7_9MYCO|nr:PH domain-containing protein [Candidatus Mycolicibacterium alkanivorans]MCI4673994.1 PH domain-containing protein [Candidatus Mycolicibacterium alkanivorans]